MKCNKCGHDMREGIALHNTLSGIPDFDTHGDVCTISYSGEAVIRKIMKCIGCGHSFIPKEKSL